MNSTSVSALAVWVVDDHPTNRLVLAQQLRLLGHLPTVAADGPSALQGWREQPGDVIIVDINMPGMDGYQFSRLIRQQEAHCARPPSLLLGYTASAGPAERERCRQSGMNDCLVKPLDLPDLGKRLDRLRSARSMTLDTAVLHSLTGGNPQLMERLVNEVLSSCRHDRAALQAVDSEPCAPLLDLAHRILGAARVIGARDVTLACEALEAEARRARPEDLGQYRQALMGRMLALEQTLEVLLLPQPDRAWNPGATGREATAP